MTDAFLLGYFVPIGCLLAVSLQVFGVTRWRCVAYDPNSVRSCLAPRKRTHSRWIVCDIMNGTTAARRRLPFFLFTATSLR